MWFDHGLKSHLNAVHVAFQKHKLVFPLYVSVLCDLLLETALDTNFSSTVMA
jgi:hypothetical protein